MLLDQIIPTYDFNEVHTTAVLAPPDFVFRTIKEVTPAEIPLFRALFALRALPAILTGKGNLLFTGDQPLLEQALQGGFVLLAEEAERELVLGIVGQFWELQGSPPPRISSLGDFRTQPAEVRVESTQGKGAWLRVVLREGRKRQIRETGSILGLPVVKIIRIWIGTLNLGNLKPGEWRYLSEAEVVALKGQPIKTRFKPRKPGPKPTKSEEPGRPGAHQGKASAGRSTLASVFRTGIPNAPLFLRRNLKNSHRNMHLSK